MGIDSVECTFVEQTSSLVKTTLLEKHMPTCLIHASDVAVIISQSFLCKASHV